MTNRIIQESPKLKVLKEILEEGFNLSLFEIP